jgi:hypothetical protein
MELPVAPSPLPPPPAPMDLETPAPSPPVHRGAHVHDGFYVRLALGFSGFSETVISKLKTGDNPRDEGYLGGFGTASELAIGGSLGRGFVLGGGVYSTNVLTSTYTQVRGTPVPDAIQRPASFSIVGLMGDWYMKPQKGFHIQAGLGLAVLSGLDVSTPRFRNRKPAFGGGAMIGAGYEWWASDEWGFGILLRATAGLVSEKDDTGERWFHLATAAPSILFSATYN